jgi:hypothetical protein
VKILKRLSFHNQQHSTLSLSRPQLSYRCSSSTFISGQTTHLLNCNTYNSHFKLTGRPNYTLDGLILCLSWKGTSLHQHPRVSHATPLYVSVYSSHAHLHRFRSLFWVGFLLVSFALYLYSVPAYSITVRSNCNSFRSSSNITSLSHIWRYT